LKKNDDNRNSFSQKKEHCKAVNVKKGKRKAIYKSFICQQHENEKRIKKREK